MDQTAKNTIMFCLDFVKHNLNTPSQVTMCRTWMRTCMDTLKAQPDMGSNGFMLNEIESVDKWLSGGDSKSTYQDMVNKIAMVESLIQGL